MSTIQHRTTRSGDRYRVVYRHLGRKLHVVTFTGLPEAERWKALLDTAGHDVATRALDEPDLGHGVRTVAEQVAHHIEHLTGVQEGTRSDYRGYLERDIAPHLGQLPLPMLTRDAGSRWVNTLTSAGMAGKTIRNRHSLLSAAMTSAVRDGLIPANPVKGLRLPDTRTSSEMTYLTHDEYLVILAAVDPKWRPLIRVLCETGMRFGEATALTVADLDFVQRGIRIRQAWKHTDGNGHELGVPKSRRSLRTVAMPSSVADDLRQLAEGRPPGAFLFTNARGGPVRHSAFHEGVWQPAVRVLAGDVPTKHRTPGRSRVTWERGNGKRPRIHDLRHTFASWAIQQRHPLTAIQYAMGHESITTTSDRYGHLRRSDLDAFAELVPVEVLPALEP